VAAASFAGAKFDRGANIIEQASLRAGASSPPASSLGSTRKGASASRFEGVALDPSGTESPAFDARSNSHHQPRAIAQKETYKATSSVIASTGSQPQDTLLEISRPTPFAGGRSGGRAGMTANVNSGALGNAHYLGQYLNCYLLFQSEGDLLVVDQHAFHERILYEELSDASRTEAIARQQLLAPILVPVPRTLVGPALEALPAFHRLGFTVEALNDGHLAVHAFPAFLPASRAAAVFDEILARVVALTDLPESEVHPLVLRARGAKAEFASLGVHERSLEAPAVYHLLHATMACHAAVRAGDPLGEELVRRLVARGSDVDFFAHCPHGRPVYRRLTEKDVAEWFMRI
jgi:DNA mismatch repair protein MutL